jgi:hypothetical protein
MLLANAFINGVLMADDMTMAPAAPAAAAASGGSKTMLIIGIIVVIAIIAAVGVFAVHSGSGGKQSGTQSTIVQSKAPTTSVSSGSPSGAGTTAASTSVAPQTTITSQSLNATLANLNATLANLSSAYSYLDKGCDLSGVTQIKVTSTNQPGMSQTYKISNSNVMQAIYVSADGKTEVTNFTGDLQGDGNILLDVVCAPSGALSEIAAVNGGNTNGKWFTYTYNGSTAYYNVNATNPNYISIEYRDPDVVINKTTINGVFMYRMNILRRTRSVSSFTTFYIPGSNPMTSESFQQIMNSANSTANLQLEYDSAIALEPSIKQYGGLSSWENLTTAGETSSIGWENYTYTFG